MAGKNWQTSFNPNNPNQGVGQQPAQSVVAQPPAPDAPNTAYGRTPTAFQDEAARTLQSGLTREAILNGTGGTNMAKMAGFGDSAMRQGLGFQAQGQQAYQDLGQDRGATQGALDRLHQFYTQGPGPSAAEAQMRQGADDNMGQAIALAHSGRGAGGNAMAMRQAQFSNAAAGQQMNAQLGTLRANEAANWRGQQLGAMGTEQQGYQGLRQTDVNNMGVNQGTGLGYQNAGQQAYGAGMQSQAGYAGMGQGAYQFGEDMRHGIYSGQQASDTNRYGADAGVAVGMREADAKDRAAALGAVGTIAGGVIGSFGGPAGTAAGAAVGGAAGSAASDVRGKKDIQPVSMADVFAQGALQGAGQGAAQGGAAGLGQAAMQGAARGATDLRPAQGYAYNYKDPNAPGAAAGPQLGPMAQDLERTPAGASTVKTGPDGKKAIDTSRLSLVNTAAISEQQRKLDQLEALLNNRARYAPGEQLPGPTQPASNIGFHQSGATGIDAMQAGPYGLPTQEEADAAARKRILAGGR